MWSRSPRLGSTTGLMNKSMPSVVAAESDILDGQPAIGLVDFVVEGVVGHLSRPRSSPPDGHPADPWTASPSSIEVSSSRPTARGRSIGAAATPKSGVDLVGELVITGPAAHAELRSSLYGDVADPGQALFDRGV